MTAKQSAVKRYVVRLSDEERERLDALTHMGKHPARLLTKHASCGRPTRCKEAGCSDSSIAVHDVRPSVVRSRQNGGRRFDESGSQTVAGLIETAHLEGPAEVD